MEKERPTLGTLLRHALDLLDGDVQRAYDADGLDYRPRYTPIVRVLFSHGEQSIRAISREAGMTHSAVSQTVAQMVKTGLVSIRPGDDGRERIVAATDRLGSMRTALEKRWRATNAAAEALNAELSCPLDTVICEAIAALERQPFLDRIMAQSSRVEVVR